jgi:hypothetical protein
MPVVYNPFTRNYDFTGAGGSTSSGSDHGQLGQLLDDDHTQYLLTNGGRQLTGNWDFGAFTISGTGDIYCNDLYTAASGVHVGTRHITDTSGVLTIDGGLNVIGDIDVGVEDVTAGIVTVYSKSEADAILRIHVDPGEDTLIPYYDIKTTAESPNLRIGPSTDPDALEYDGNDNWWLFKQETKFFQGTVSIGKFAVAGDLTLYGAATGSVVGGKITLHTADDHDTTIANYVLDVNEDDLLIGPDTDTDALKYNGANNIFQTSASGGFDFSLGGRSGLLGLPAVNGTFVGITEWVHESEGGGATSYQPVYYKAADQSYENASATDSTKMPARGLVGASGGDGEPYKILRYGYMYNSAWNWTVGAEVYVAAGGGITETPPAAGGNIVQNIGYAVTADIIFFNPSSEWYELVP